NIASLRKTKLWSRLMVAPGDARFPNGETSREVQSRIVGEVTSIVERHPRAAVAIVTHADPVKLVLAHYLGVHVDLYPRIIVGPASVSAVLAGDGVPRVLKVNDTGEVTDLVPPRRSRNHRPPQRPGRGAR